MKFLLTMVLAMAFSVPALAQRPHDKGAHGKVRVERHVGEKSCPKCDALKKEVAYLQKRLEASAKGRPGTKGKRGGRSNRGRSNRFLGESPAKGRPGTRRSDRFGGKRSTSRRPNTRNGMPTKRAKNAKEMMDVGKKWLDINSDERKKWGDALKKRLKDMNKGSSRGDWRKFIQMRK